MSVNTQKIASPETIATRITLNGRVQGIGMRPAIARLAQQLSLTGYVDNTQGGVEIHVEGPVADVKRFEHECQSGFPEAAQLSSFVCTNADVAGFESFQIGRVSDEPTRSVDRSAARSFQALSVRVPADVVACSQCLADLRNASDRRHGYPFTSCTDCGPRYSIIERMPYERVDTGMAAFPLCDRCRGEYQSASDRRFHAQTNACAQCGPRYWLRGSDSRVIAHGDEALRAAAAAILDGRIVSLKGLGGYQLLVDATSHDAVDRLRQRKRRRGKPLAVMVSSLVEAERFAQLDATEQRLLSAPMGPIVVALARSDTELAASVAAELKTIGLMLPTTPLHILLLEVAKRPLVCTSANLEGEPLIYEPDDASARLRGVSDLWLEHDRPIRRPVDDSVVRVISGRPVTIRLARGYAPLSLDVETEQPLIALGGHQKTSIALSNAAQAVLGPHIGDLDSIAARERFVGQVSELSELYGIDGCPLVCDAHPEYFTTQWAETRVLSVIPVQHHHAHVVTGMVEHGWQNRQVLGVSFDGTGYGADGTIWGGEFMLATAANFERVGHLRSFLLAGGEHAVRQPWRVATALVHDAVGEEQAARLPFQVGDPSFVVSVLQRPKLSPQTTSAGRLFDGIAALVLGIEQCQFEGQAAMLLEDACDLSTDGQYDILIRDSRPRQLDWRPLVRQVIRDRAAVVPPGAMAMRFHRGLANAIFELCRRYATLPVVLGGGVFQNRLLTELLVERFAETNQPLGLPGRIPPNDGGLAAGQLAIAAARQRGAGSCA